MWFLKIFKIFTVSDQIRYVSPARYEDCTKNFNLWCIEWPILYTLSQGCFEYDTSPAFHYVHIAYRYHSKSIDDSGLFKFPSSIKSQCEYFRVIPLIPITCCMLPFYLHDLHISRQQITAVGSSWRMAAEGNSVLVSIKSEASIHRKTEE